MGQDRVTPDILLVNHANEWAELQPQTDEGKRFVSMNYAHFDRQAFRDPNEPLPAIPFDAASGFAIFAAESGLIVLQRF